MPAKKYKRKACGYSKENSEEGKVFNDTALAKMEVYGRVVASRAVDT